MNSKANSILTNGLICVVTAVAMCSFTRTANARYAQQQLDKTPIDRLVTNLEKQVEANPKNAKLRHNLARVHAMAYASKSETAPTARAGKTLAVWFGYEPRPVPFVNQPTKDEQKLKVAKEHLGKAIARYKEVIKIDPNHFIARLGLGWCLDQADRDMEAINAYRKTIELGWNKEKAMKFGPLGWHSIVAEAHKYLKPHLDPKADAVEIARNEERIAKLRRVPRPVTPIAIPLADGLTASDLEDRSASVFFDADGSNETKRWSWITPNAAWLVYDRERIGKITSALQMFGNVSFWCFWDNGYQALASLDDNDDGTLTGNELDGLSLWHDVNSDGVSDPGEVRPIADHDIIALSCRWNTDARHPDKIATSPQGVMMSDGTKRASFDLILHSRPDEK